MFFCSAIPLQAQQATLIRIKLDRFALMPLDAHQVPDITGAEPGFVMQEQSAEFAVVTSKYLRFESNVNGKTKLL
ncbi:hypothetical protein [Pseudomonas gingeri]